MATRILNSTQAIDTLTAKGAQLAAMLAIVRASPEAFDALGADDRAAYLWACHDAAEAVRDAAVSVATWAAVPAGG